MCYLYYGVLNISDRSWNFPHTDSTTLLWQATLKFSTSNPEVFHILIQLPCHNKQQWSSPHTDTELTVLLRQRTLYSDALQHNDAFNTWQITYYLSFSPCSPAYWANYHDKEPGSSPTTQYWFNYLVMTKNREEVACGLAAFPAIGCQSLRPKVTVGLSTMVVEVVALAGYHQWWLEWLFLHSGLGLLALHTFLKMSLHLVGGGDSR